MNGPLFEFVPEVFWKVLGITIAVALVGFAVSIWVYGTITVTDIGGTLISAVIFAYMVHLWIVMGRRSSDRDSE